MPAKSSVHNYFPSDLKFVIIVKAVHMYSVNSSGKKKHYHVTHWSGQHVLSISETFKFKRSVLQPENFTLAASTARYLLHPRVINNTFDVSFQRHWTPLVIVTDQYSNLVQLVIEETNQRRNTVVAHICLISDALKNNLGLKSVIIFYRGFIPLTTLIQIRLSVRRFDTSIVSCRVSWPSG